MASFCHMILSAPHTSNLKAVWVARSAIFTLLFLTPDASCPQGYS